MPRIPFAFLLLVALGLLGVPAAGQEQAAAVTLSVSPASAMVGTALTQHFTAVVTGTKKRGVNFAVCDANGKNCVVGGNDTLGTITIIGKDAKGNRIGRYTAPASIPAPPACATVVGGCQLRIRAKMTYTTYRRRKAFGDATIHPALGVLVRASLANDGAEADSGANVSAVSANGRYVAFESSSGNLVPGDAGGASDIFLRDTCVGAAPGCTPSTTEVSVTSGGNPGNAVSLGPAISADGRFVAFSSLASDLVAGDTNGSFDFFVRDTCVGATGCGPTTVRVSVANDGAQASGSGTPAISADGRFVAFDSAGDNLVAGDTNGALDVFVRDTCAGASGCTPSTIRVSVAGDGAESNFASYWPTISGDGRFVAFVSEATNLVAGDTNNTLDVFVRDTCRGATGCTPSTIRVSVANDGAESNYESAYPMLNAGGRFVTFTSAASNLVTDDTNDGWDTFVRDTCVGASVGCIPSTIRVSVASDGTESFVGSEVMGPSISADGRFVAFSSLASDLVAGDTNGFKDIFVRDTCAGAPAGCSPTTVRASVTTDGAQGNHNSLYPVLNANGHVVVFVSLASNLPAGDTNGAPDVFVACTGH